MRQWVIVAGLALSASLGWAAGEQSGARGRAAATTAPPAAVDPNLWAIDTNHTEAGFSVTHMLISTVTGRLGPVTGRVWYDGVKPESIRADASIDVKGLNTGIDKRDEHLRTDEFFNAPKFPTITFKSKRVAPGTAPGHFGLVGDLTIRDVTKEVTLDVDGPRPILKSSREWRTAVTATTTVNRFDYGLRYNSLIETGGLVVSADVKVTINLEVVKAIK